METSAKYYYFMNDDCCLITLNIQALSEIRINWIPLPPPKLFKSQHCLCLLPLSSLGYMGLVSLPEA